MDFKPRYRIQAQMAAMPSKDSLAHTLPVPVFIAMKRLKGIRQFARCSFEGFHSTESDAKGKYLWSRGESSVICHFPMTAKLQYAWIEVASTAPEGSDVTIALNGKTLVQDKRIKGRSTIVAKLPSPEILHQLTLDIFSSTFQPETVTQGNDSVPADERELGVALRAIVFGKRASKYRPGSVVRPSLHKKLAQVLPWNRSKRRRLAA